MSILPHTLSLVIGSDHAGYVMKTELLAYIKCVYPSLVMEDVGTFSEASCDYPDFAHKVAMAVDKGIYEKGILLCGTANGVAMVANKYAKVRAAVVWTELVVQLVRQHNDANILCIPARFITISLMQTMVHTFLYTDFEGGRHEQRVRKISMAK